MTDTAPSANPLAPAIYALTIERFRGITSLKWKPSRGVNVILGGDGKITISSGSNSKSVRSHNLNNDLTEPDAGAKLDNGRVAIKPEACL